MRTARQRALARLRVERRDGQNHLRLEVDCRVQPRPLAGHLDRGLVDADPSRRCRSQKIFGFMRAARECYERRVASLGIAGPRPAHSQKPKASEDPTKELRSFESHRSRERRRSLSLPPFERSCVYTLPEQVLSSREHRLLRPASVSRRCRCVPSLGEEWARPPWTRSVENRRSSYGRRDAVVTVWNGARIGRGLFVFDREPSRGRAGVTGNSARSAGSSALYRSVPSLEGLPS